MKAKRQNPKRSAKVDSAGSRFQALRGVAKGLFKAGEWEKSILADRKVFKASMRAQDVVAREAKHGEKMIEVKLRFWTDEIAADPGKIRPKHAWTSGVVRVEGNQSHGIKPLKPRPFNSLLDVGSVIERVLIEHRIMLHPGRSMRRYLHLGAGGSATRDRAHNSRMLK